ncbi:MAG: hypothetical protein P0S95_08295 [Rhabdochlamydiaceae bacterium]|nr:hypothetical protein [Candidatus Amphrikana amoebophyrae]
MAGSEPQSAEDSTSYNITTNQDNMKITGRLSDSIPAGSFLETSLEAPSGASSTGYQSLSTTDVNLVTAISEVAETNLPLNLRYTSKVSAGTSRITRDIIFTLQAE